MLKNAQGDGPITDIQRYSEPSSCCIASTKLYYLWYAFAESSTALSFNFFKILNVAALVLNA